MKIIPVHLAWRKPGIFLSVFSPPLLATAIGLHFSPHHWPYYIATVGSAFAITLTLMESLADRAIADNWGRISRAVNPGRYWLQIAVWIAMYLCTIAAPIILCRKT